MADDMCGPSNAYKGLASHLDRDRSLQQDRLQGGSASPAQGFRSANAHQASAVNADFASFQNGNMPLQHFDAQQQQPLGHGPGSQGMMPPQWQPATGARLMQSPQVRLGSTQSDWAQQFQNMSLGSQAHAQAAQPGPLMQPFPALSIPQGFDHPVQPWQEPARFQPSYMPGPTYQQPPLQQRPHQQLPAFEQEIDDWIFESLAAQNRETQAKQQEQEKTENARADEVLHGTPVPLPVEQEQPLREEQPEEAAGEDPTQLARAAQDVLNAVSNNQTDKFKKSAFFELMDKIATGTKVLQNNDFVDADGGGGGDQPAAAATSHQRAALDVPIPPP